jgi:pyruvate/2-oxoglutarate dehydrogenase complex dihydrolipoamide dehydrogenase (E3) component
MPENFDVVVVGGGTAGLVTASGCARLGRKVALIEREKRPALGGDCLWTGCVPTKALVASAKLAHQMRHASDWGLEAQEPKITPRSIMDAMREARRVISKHDDPEKFRKLGIDVIDGEAKLTARDTVQVEGRTLKAKDIVIATGSRTAVPPIEGLKEAGFIDHASFLERNEFPKTLLVLGGGVIGIEFAQVFRRFGTDVVVVEMLDDIMIKEDRDVITRIREILTEEGIKIRTSWTVKKVRVENGKKVVRIENKSGDSEEISVDEIFVASGRRGNSENIGLEEAGVKLNKSWVWCDDYLQTSVPRIWACGDIHGGPAFTHVAAFEAVKLVRNLLFPGKSAVSYEHVPWGVYTDPEVGHIGMTEDEAKAAFGADEVKTYKVEMADVDRAVVDRMTKGFIKFVVNKKGKILGAHILSVGASALIEQIVLARKKGASIGELAQLVSAYPSMPDAITKAAGMHYQNLSTSWVGTLGKRIAAWSQ